MVSYDCDGLISYQGIGLTTVSVTYGVGVQARAGVAFDCCGCDVVAIEKARRPSGVWGWRVTDEGLHERTSRDEERIECIIVKGVDSHKMLPCSGINN